MLTSPDPSPRSQKSPAAGGRAIALTAENSLADAVESLRAAAGASPERQREFASAVRSLGKLVGREPQAIPASIESIQRLLDQVPEAVRTRSRKTVANIKSRIKSGLVSLRAGILSVPRGYPLTGEWAQLHGALPDRRLRNGLSRIMRLACYQCLRPDEMSDAFLASVVDAYRVGKWSGNPARYQRTVANLWNEAAATLPGWPQVTLTPPTSLARPKHLPLTAFPASFVADLDAYLAWLSGTDVLAASAPPRVYKPTTVKLRSDSLRLAASTLAEAIGDPESVVSLAALVQPVHVKTILTIYRQRAGNINTAFIHGLAVALVAVARHWVKLDPKSEAMQALKVMAGKASKLPQGLTPKNKKVLRQLEDQVVKQRLIDLPGILAKQARAGRLSPGRRAQKFQIAVAIELLLAVPLRMKNLSTLRFDEQLVWPNGPGGALFIVLADQETKNAEPLEYEVPEHARALLTEYRDRYRVLLQPGSSPWLFIGKEGKPTSDTTLRDGIVKAVRREVGIAMTPHQFRHFAAQVVLDAHPDGYPLAMDLLGHKNLKTTSAFYSGRRSRQAGKVYDEVLRRPLPQNEP